MKKQIDPLEPYHVEIDKHRALRDWYREHKHDQLAQMTRGHINDHIIEYYDHLQEVQQAFIAMLVESSGMGDILREAGVEPTFIKN